MAQSSRFAVAVHVLTLLASVGETLTSETIAGSVNTNPVVIRRLVAQLVRAGLVISHPGSGGGVALARRAAEISLEQVRQAVEGKARVALPPCSPNPACLVGANVQAVLLAALARSERARETELAKTSVADLARAVRRAAQKNAPANIKRKKAS